MKRFFTVFTDARAAVLAAAAVLLLAACDQSAIFNSISNETQKNSCLIGGSPTRVVDTGSALFVANGALWKRAYGGTWATVSASFTYAAGGTESGLKIRDLQKSGTTLYAITVKDVDTISENTTSTYVWTSADGVSWTQITNSTGYTADSLYVANGYLFVGAHKADSSKTYETAYALLTESGGALSTSNIADMGDGGTIVGVTYDGTHYYAASTNNGVFYTDSTDHQFTTTSASTSTYLSTSTGYALTGMYSFSGGATIAFGRDEYTLVKTTAAGTSFTATDQSYIFDGAYALYDTAGDGTPDYLLLGIKTGTTYGYREIALSGGQLTDAAPSLSKPSSSTTVNSYDTYAGSLGVVAIRHLYQSWEGGTSTNILYASAVGQGQGSDEGLWSCKNKGDWNLVSE